MTAVLVVLVILVVLGILGAVVKGLLWLTFIAALLFVGGAIYGFVKFKGSSSS
ncbi:MAG: hypothetical protein WA964_16710 [Ilumatobacter sp.]|uniref:hypothetical protein n=1 Tax=Ilumatobacter sp. TaxID=1967498 RepID=UPI003C741429